MQPEIRPILKSFAGEMRKQLRSNAAASEPALAPKFQRIDPIETVRANTRASSDMGKLILGILGAVAEFETDIRKERQREGIERAKAAAVYKGRKPTVDVEQVRSLNDQGLGATDIATKLGIARRSVYRALKNEAVAVT